MQVDEMTEKNHDVSGYSYVVNNPMLFTDPFGLDTSSANVNKPVHKGDFIIFDKGGSATQSVDEATVTGSRNLSNSNGVYNIENDLRWTQTLLFDHRKDNDPTRLIDNALAFLNPYKALQSLTVFSKINPFNKSTVATQLTVKVIKTQWGWSGTKVWKDLVNTVRNGGTLESLAGKIPKKSEAIKLIDEAGGKIERIEGAHLPPNPHNYNHINYTTSSGTKGTLKIVEL
jgi:hypothetical protein